MATRQELINRGWDPDPMFQALSSYGPAPGLRNRIGGCHDTRAELERELEQNGYTKSEEVFVKDDDVVSIEFFYLPLTL